MEPFALKREWLVVDHRGAFAMGTPEGVRRRKYHGFFMGIAGRSETAFLADLDFECNGFLLWPHCYLSPEGPIFSPELDPSVQREPFQSTRQGPEWGWTLPSELGESGESEQSGQGTLRFQVTGQDSGGIALRWSWNSKNG